MPSNHLILCRPLLLPPSIFPSIRFFSNESAIQMAMRWPKYWSFSFHKSGICSLSEVKVTGPCCLDKLWGGPFVALPASGSSRSSLGSRLCLSSHGLLCGSVSSPLRGIHRWIQDPSDNPRHPVWRSVTSSHQKGPFSRRGHAHKWVRCEYIVGATIQPHRLTKV